MPSAGPPAIQDAVPYTTRPVLPHATCGSHDYSHVVPHVLRCLFWTTVAHPNTASGAGESEGSRFRFNDLTRVGPYEHGLKKKSPRETQPIPSREGPTLAGATPANVGVT